MENYILGFFSVLLVRQNVLLIYVSTVDKHRHESFKQKSIT